MVCLILDSSCGLVQLLRHCVGLCAWQLLLLFFSKWRIHFFWSMPLWQLQFDYDDSWGSEINWTRDQEQTERTKSTTHIYLSHSPRRGHVCAADRLQKITCMREWPRHFARRHRMWHSSKRALITRTNRTLSFHLNIPDKFHILDWAHPESHFCKSVCILYLLAWSQKLDLVKVGLGSHC